MRQAVAFMLVLAATQTAAHWASPDEIVAGMLSPAARVATGVDRADRDGVNPRLLVVRVGPTWYDLPEAIRTATATEWYGAWRHTVPQGVVAVLDARTDEPVVRYGRDGMVVGLR